MMPTDSSPPSLSLLFTEIEQATPPYSSQSGIVRRRIPTSSSCDLFIGVQKPANIRLLSVRIRANALPEIYDLPEFKSLDIQVHSEIENHIERETITLLSPKSEWNDIFTSLAEDISASVGRQEDGAQAAVTLLRRLYQWQRFLEKAGVNGLNEEQQQGLYGELWCMREIILPVLNTYSAISAWTHPEAANRDLQFAAAIAIEVKTTRSTGPQVLTISSERQLDDTGLNALHLLHLSLEHMRGAGETLSQIIECLRSLTAVDAISGSFFEDKLIAAGYLDIHSTKYQSEGYAQHEIHCYLVDEGFPRIISQDLLEGVGNVCYVVSAAACLPFVVETNVLKEQIKERL